jgi:hypothetical protein
MQGQLEITMLNCVDGDKCEALQEFNEIIMFALIADTTEEFTRDLNRRKGGFKHFHYYLTDFGTVDIYQFDPDMNERYDERIMKVELER